MKKILVTRFSAMGDVAIAVHVISAIIEQNPDIEILFVTKNPFRKLFQNIPRVTLINIELKNKHKGLIGLYKFSNELSKKHKLYAFADIHNVIRTKIIKIFLSGKIKKAKIDKGRKEKKQLTKRKNKKLHQLKHSAQRYADVFLKLGLKADLSKKIQLPIYAPSKNIAPILNIEMPKIGIAPFAKHKSKAYPTDKMEEVIKQLSKNNTVILFGGGKKEKKITEKWQNKFKNVISIIGKYSMPDEIALINNCNTMVTMDSGNMHLASLTKTKIISIWGATHPFLGFAPFNKPNTLFIQKKLKCRPCSVFGNKKCYKNTWECLDIFPEKITKATVS